MQDNKHRQKKNVYHISCLKVNFYCLTFGKYKLTIINPTNFLETCDSPHLLTLTKYSTLPSKILEQLK